MIIGFTGKKRSGKSTASAYLMQKFPDAVRVNFKDALVAEIKDRFPDLIKAIIDTMDKIAYDGMNPWNFERLVKDKPPLFRTLMQNYGTEVRRRDHPDYWVTKWVKTAAYRTIDSLQVVDDVRFVNEADAIKRMGGIIIRIVRTDIASDDGHASETEMDQIVADYTIEVATGEHEELYDRLYVIVASHQQKTSGTAD